MGGGPFYAHSENALGRRELMSEHVARVARYASSFTPCPEMAAELQLAARLHDPFNTLRHRLSTWQVLRCSVQNAGTRHSTMEAR